MGGDTVLVREVAAYLSLPLVVGGNALDGGNALTSLVPRTGEIDAGEGRGKFRCIRLDMVAALSNNLRMCLMTMAPV